MRRPRGPRTSTFRLKPILAIYALIGFGTLTLWLLTIQLAFHLAEIGFGSPLLAGTRTRHTLSHGHLDRGALRAGEAILRFSVNRSLCIHLDGARIRPDFSGCKHAAYFFRITAGWSWLWSQPTKLFSMAPRCCSGRSSRQGGSRAYICGMFRATRVAVYLSAIGNDGRFGRIIRRCRRHVLIDRHGLAFRQEPVPRPADGYGATIDYVIACD